MPVELASWPMSMPADYHMHTPLCHHAEGEPTDYAAHALSVGLDEIGFSEHNPMIRDDFDDWHMSMDCVGEYVEKIEKARVDHPDLCIRMALEVDYLPGHEEWIRTLSSQYPWDYLIGSVHYISEAWDIDNPKKISEWESSDPWDVWSKYFERLAQAAESGLFNIIGHPDLPKKFCFYPEKDCTPLYVHFLDACKNAGIAFELNTAGLRKDCKEIYPCPSFLELAHERKIPITFGSDAHKPGEVGCDFHQAIQLARKTGYSHTLRFEKRRSREVAI